MKAFLTNLFVKIRLVLIAFFALPLISDIVEFFGRQAVLSVLLGFVCYVLVPTIQIPRVPTEYMLKAGDYLFIAALGLAFRFSVEGIIEARGSQPKTQSEYISLIIDQVQTFIVQEIKKYLMKPAEPGMLG